MTKLLSQPLFPDGQGILLSAGKDIFELDRQKVIEAFESCGAVLLRGFDLSHQTAKEFIDQFTFRYSGDASRRGKRFGSNIFRNVDAGTIAHALHSEGSFTPTWPEVLWFYCITPPQVGGATTLCDGMDLWNRLSLPTRNFFQMNPIRYDIEISIDQTKKGWGEKEWQFNVEGAANAKVDWETGVVKLSQVRFAAKEGRLNRSMCFVNHLISDHHNETQIKRITLLNGEEIPKEVVNESKLIAEPITHEIAWEKNDLIMIDNMRFMHGRRAFNQGDPRDIVVIQTARASFGYGATTRQFKPNAL